MALSELTLRSMEWAVVQIEQKYVLPELAKRAIDAARKWLRGDIGWEELKKLGDEVFELYKKIVDSDPSALTKNPDVDEEFANLVSAMVSSFVELDQMWQKAACAQARIRVLGGAVGARNHAADWIEILLRDHLALTLEIILGQDYKFWQRKLLLEVVAPYLRENSRPTEKYS
ncbi:MAG: hypothetical protein MUD10_04460 [Candidatus Pacebacteria bacterium]|nr:hypothetical protein [Candidatus Paceibacterota bacterium]